MNILITGVGRQNKGAELMLLAILDQLKKRLPGARPVIHPGSGPYEWRARLGLFQLFDPLRASRLGWVRKTLFRQIHRESFGLVVPEEVDVVFDASGYAYGDAWKPEWVESAANELERFKSFGASIILLPQALGPFENSRIREAAERIFAVSDLVYARDTESMGFCKTLISQHLGLSLAPDFTNLLEGELPDDWRRSDRIVTLVPNRKMLSHTPTDVSDRYVPFMIDVRKLVSAAGYEPVILVHEEQDSEIAQEIALSSEVPCRIVREKNPLRIKGMLGASTFTIGSRFHGLVSALSQGAPSIGTAWSHKYGRLFTDYGIPDMICPINVADQGFRDPFERILDSEERSSLARHLLSRSRLFKMEVQRLWDRVFSELERE